VHLLHARDRDHCDPQHFLRLRWSILNKQMLVAQADANIPVIYPSPESALTNTNATSTPAAAAAAAARSESLIEVLTVVPSAAAWPEMAERGSTRYGNSVVPEPQPMAKVP